MNVLIYFFSLRFFELFSWQKSTSIWYSIFVSHFGHTFTCQTDNSSHLSFNVSLLSQILLVSNNRLTSLPDELGKMSHLAELDASCNQLTHLPPRMGELRRLQSLILRNNLLLCLPIEVTYLRLVRLDLTANRINTLPVELRDMTSLISLSVEDNPLTSPPASVSFFSFCFVYQCCLLFYYNFNCVVYLNWHKMINFLIRTVAI